MSRRPGGLRSCPIFKTTGNSAMRHSLNDKRHKNCGKKCPAYSKLKNPQYVREPTLAEWKKWAVPLATEYADLVNEVQAELGLEEIVVGESNSEARDDLDEDLEVEERANEEEGPNEEEGAGIGGESARGESPPGTRSSIVSEIGLDLEGGSGSIPRSWNGNQEEELKKIPDCRG